LPIGQRGEALLAAVAVDPGVVHEMEKLLTLLPMMTTWRARLEWHLAHPGVLPIVEALRILRVLAEEPPGCISTMDAVSLRDRAHCGLVGPVEA
jgi:hypothetical protein